MKSVLVIVVAVHEGRLPRSLPSVYPSGHFDLQSHGSRRATSVPPTPPETDLHDPHRQRQQRGRGVDEDPRGRPEVCERESWTSLSTCENFGMKPHLLLAPEPEADASAHDPEGCHERGKEQGGAEDRTRAKKPPHSVKPGLRDRAHMPDSELSFAAGGETGQDRKGQEGRKRERTSPLSIREVPQLAALPLPRPGPPEVDPGLRQEQGENRGGKEGRMRDRKRPECEQGASQC